MLYTPTTNDIDKMNRTDLVFELAKKCHIDHYHRAITWPTEILRKLLNWYNTEDKKLDTGVYTFIMGLDFGEGESKTYTHTFVLKGKEYPLMSGMIRKYWHLIK